MEYYAVEYETLKSAKKLSKQSKIHNLTLERDYSSGWTIISGTIQRIEKVSIARQSRFLTGSSHTTSPF